MDSINIVHKLRNRQLQERDHSVFQQKQQVTAMLVSRLGLEKELEGHTGCVNCLEWNSKGTLLASGSDDLETILWNPFLHKKLTTIKTGHHGNIFSIKFLPDSNDNVLATCAADTKVRIHDVSRGETTQAFSCHAGRAKRLATAPNLPYMLWSAGEDGTIRQFDLRMPHTCGDSCENVLINLNTYIGNHAECKCLAINQYRPELLAVGANDPYVRLYDIRMLSPYSVRFSGDERHDSPWQTPAPDPDAQGNLPQGCVQYFVAAHLPTKEEVRRRRYPSLVSTYITFSPNGNEILVNLGGEQVYLFDIVHHRKPKGFKTGDYILPVSNNNGICKDVSSTMAEALSSNGTSVHSSNGLTKGIASTSKMKINMDNNRSCAALRRSCLPTKELPPKADSLKLRANEFYCEKKDYTNAIRLYNEALSIAPNSPILYANRAAAYQRRKWEGDIYGAVRDCHKALSLDPSHRKAQFRLAQCLYELDWFQEAGDCLKQFKIKFPDYIKDCEELDKGLKAKHNNEEGDLNKGSNITLPLLRFGRSGREFQLSDHEVALRRESWDYQQRYCGHCNTTTDIKEANFFGSDGQFVIAGSDDGSFFIWDRKSTNIMQVFRGDESIVNCLQPHPTCCYLATSGIDPVVRLWSPQPEDGKANERNVTDRDSAALANQRRMIADPLEVLLMNMAQRISGMSDGSDDDSNSEAPDQCRPS
ncbi:WD and tetratricopeptide repeats protein 1-like [Anneissia japonica]|uniref:WD and tetratricopeptide repeats protein 1-like n=1 Tax=Anneissia japonica TaxID=1529436 RepID=UPI001425A9A1|nr:WD and tetratricopeptide repeats protein 1-like [Anneissia japonica]